MKHKPELTRQSIQEFQVIDKKALIKRKKAENKKQRLQTAHALLKAERTTYILELAHSHWLNKQNLLEYPNLSDLLLQVHTRKEAVTRSHIKGSRSHPLIRSHRKKGYAAKLRKKFNST